MIFITFEILAFTSCACHYKEKKKKKKTITVQFRSFSSKLQRFNLLFRVSEVAAYKRANDIVCTGSFIRSTVPYKRLLSHANEKEVHMFPYLTMQLT